MKMNSTMKISILFVLFYVHFSAAFMTDRDFKLSPLLQCYNSKSESRLTTETVNGQELPLPSSIETFVAIVERLETAYPTMSTADVVQKLLLSFRVDGLSGNFRGWDGKDVNEIEKAFFGVPDNPSYAWKEEDFTQDEKCALHFMLSHSVNATALGQTNEELEENGINTKRPRELGVVSLHGKWKHAFSLHKVLLGILAGLSGNNQVGAADIYRKIKGRQDSQLGGLKVNRLIAVTIGDLISVYVNKYYDIGEAVVFLPNGQWNEATCPTQYTLPSNNKKYITNSDVRGAVDGLIIGKKLEEKPQIYQKMRLSQILRLYYGPTGLIDDLESTARSDTQWCNRERNFEALANIREEVNSFYTLYCAVIGYYALDTSTPEKEISEVLAYLQKSSEIFSEVAMEASSECGSSDLTMDKRCTTPFDIFAVLDMSTPDLQRNFQIEVIGNLSNNFDVRPNGNSIGVYTNLNPTQNKGLQTIVNNTGISGCQSCYTKYTTRRSSKNSEIQVFENLNETLTEFVAFYDQAQKEVTDFKSGAPAKIVLYFNYGTALNDDYKLRDAIWQVEKHFREATILAIGPSKEALMPYTLNHDMDIFVTPSSAANAADFAAKLKSRICKAPAEFQFRECNQSSRSTEAENRQVNNIAVNKKQYWAMFPKYFHRSFGITLKFRPLEGAQIKVCYSRYHYRILEDNSQYTECYESSGDEIKFYANNPCNRKNVHTCYPFYFSVEGKKAPSTACESIKCNSPKDIQFEFQHEGISCNSASFLSASTLAVLLSALLYYLQKH